MAYLPPVSRKILPFLALLLALGPGPAGAGARVLFDASHRENAGNADWVIDADAWDLHQEHYPCGQWEDESHAQRFPTPAPGEIGPDDPETTWTGGISAFGIDLVKLGYEVETLPVEGAITFGDPDNPQDLSRYDVFVLPEPNRPFTPEEIDAIRRFVREGGGGIFLVADHQTSDRDCDGWDAPHVLNELLGVEIEGGAVTDPGIAGIVFNVEEIAGLGDGDFWFDDPVDDNVTDDPGDPIVHGPHGDGSGGLGLFGSTALTLYPAANGTVRGHVWKTDAPERGNVHVTFATAWVGGGRVAATGDSSPADDGTGDPGDHLHDGWDRASGGVNNREIFLNAVAWLADAEPDTVPPGRVEDLAATSTGATTVRLEWTAPGNDGDEGRAARYDIRRAPWPIRTPADFAAATPLDGEPDPGPAGSHESWDVTGLAPGTAYWFALVAEDGWSNRSDPSNTAGATTGPAGAGGGPGADHPVISEVQTRGVSDHDDEFIELHDPTGEPVSLAGWSLQYRAATGSTWLVFALPAETIPAHGYYLVARPEYTGDVPADAVQDRFLMGASGGLVFLVEGTAPLASCDDPAIVDKVGWGTANCPEGTAAPAHGPGESIERAPGADDPACGNGTDTDDNGADFAIRSPAEPQNRSSGPEGPCGGSVDPPGEVGPSLWLGDPGRDDLRWAAAWEADHYRVRRGDHPDFVATHPPPDPADVVAEPADPAWTDTSLPPAGACLFYFTTAVAADGAESPD